MDPNKRLKLRDIRFEEFYNKSSSGTRPAGNSMSLEDIRQKIRSLRALERGATTQGEAEAAARAAAALLERYRLSEAEVEAAGAEPNEACILDDEPVYSYRRAEQWRMDLVNVLSDGYGVVMYRERKFGRRADKPKGRVQMGFDYKICLVGRPSDVLIVRYLYSWLSVEAVRLLPESPRYVELKVQLKETLRRLSVFGDAHVQRKGAKLKRLLQTHKLRDDYSWLLGFVRGIGDQVEKARAEVREGGSKTALVKLNERKDDAYRYLRACFPDVESYTDRKRKVHAEAYKSGRDRGQQQHLGDALSSGQKALPEASEG